MTAFSDKEFVSGCMNGDRHVIDVLVATYYPRVFSLCLKVLGSRDEAEDICQDVFMRVLDKAHRFRFKSSLKTWILSIAYNLCMNRIKASKHQSYMTLEKYTAEAEDITGVEQAMLNEQRIEVIEHALGELNAEEKILIEMYYLDECSIKDIALILDKTETAAKTGLFRARQKLKTLVLNKKDHEYN